jgi:hypothetical protein
MPQKAHLLKDAIIILLSDVEQIAEIITRGDDPDHRLLVTRLMNYRKGDLESALMGADVCYNSYPGKDDQTIYHILSCPTSSTPP